MGRPQKPRKPAPGLPSRLAEILDLSNRSAVARTFGVGVSTLDGWLDGEYEPSLEFLEKVSEQTGRTVDWLVKGADPPGEYEVPTYMAGAGAHWQVADGEAPFNTVIPRGLIAFQVNGDSMDPIARHGQSVLINPLALVRDGDLAVVELADGTRSFKRVYHQGHRWVLVSVNVAYEPRVVEEREVSRIWKAWGVRFSGKEPRRP